MVIKISNNKDTNKVAESKRLSAATPRINEGSKAGVERGSYTKSTPEERAEKKRIEADIENYKKRKDAEKKAQSAEQAHRKQMDRLASKIYTGLERLGYTVYASQDRYGYEISRKYEKNLQPAKDYLTKAEVPFDVKKYGSRLYLTALLPESARMNRQIKQILESRESAREILFNQPTPREQEEKAEREAEERRYQARQKLGLPQPPEKKKLTGKDLLNQKTPGEIEREQEAERQARKERAMRILGIRK